MKYIIVFFAGVACGVLGPVACLHKVADAGTKTANTVDTMVKKTKEVKEKADKLGKDAKEVGDKLHK